MSLPSLPLDILLVVLRELDIVDVVRTGMTCKDLYWAIHDRHVWVDQHKKLLRKDPALRSATPPLISLSAQELKTFVTCWVKLRLRWDKRDDENGFVEKGLIELPGVNELRLMPGGRSVLVIGSRGGVTMRRIELDDGQVSLPVVASVKYDQKIIVGLGWNKLLTAISPCPILVHRQGNIVHLIKVDHHNDTMSLETSFPIPDGYGFRHAHGQGRVVGFLIQRFLEPPRAVVIHLDYPGISMESKVSPPYATEAGSTSYLWNICIPTESLVVVYNTRHILAYKIPDFSSLSLGVNLSDVTPAHHWPGPDLTYEAARNMVLYTTSEALYDPPSTREFNLHYICGGRPRVEPFTITVTIPINTEDDFAPNLTEPAPKQKLTRIQSHEWDSVRPSCRKGLHSNLALRGGKIDILVTPLDDLVLEGGRGALRMSAPYKEFGDCLEMTEVDMDEATGRVVIWRWDESAWETKVFVGDLV